MSDASILSTNIAIPQPDPAGADRRSGITKVPADHLDVFAPGPSYGDGSGVEGDFVGDSEHHGGAQKAVYAFSREQLDYWQAELGRPLGPGAFGENLTTRGIDVDAAGCWIPRTTGPRTAAAPGVSISQASTPPYRAMPRPMSG